MKLRYVTKEQARRKGSYLVTKLQGVLKEFMESDETFAMMELEEGEYRNVSSAYSSVYAAIKRFGYPLRVRKIGDNVYLEKI